MHRNFWRIAVKSKPEAEILKLIGVVKQAVNYAPGLLH